MRPWVGERPQLAERLHRVRARLGLRLGQRRCQVERNTDAGQRGAADVRATTGRDDVWYKPYDHAADYKQHARDYLAWEVALVDQIKRDPTIRFRAY